MRKLSVVVHRVLDCNTALTDGLTLIFGNVGKEQRQPRIAGRALKKLHAAPLYIADFGGNTEGTVVPAEKENIDVSNGVETRCAALRLAG